MTAQKNKQGFTLVELLIIIGIIAILFGVILVAVDPARRFAQARNAQRSEDVRDILEAILEYTTDNKGNLPAGIDSLPGSVQVLRWDVSVGCLGGCAATAPLNTVDGCLDLRGSLVEAYLAEIPIDPRSGYVGFADYYIDKTSGGRILVGACEPELGETIRVSR